MSRERPAPSASAWTVTRGVSGYGKGLYRIISSADDVLPDEEVVEKELTLWNAEKLRDDMMAVREVMGT